MQTGALSKYEVYRQTQHFNDIEQCVLHMAVHQNHHRAPFFTKG